MLDAEMVLKLPNPLVDELEYMDIFVFATEPVMVELMPVVFIAAPELLDAWKTSLTLGDMITTLDPFVKREGAGQMAAAQAANVRKLAIILCFLCCWESLLDRSGEPLKP